MTLSASNAEASEHERSPLKPSIVLAMAAACGFSVANIYYNQPMLVEIIRSFDVGEAYSGAIPTATQIGYALGLLFLAPLGDRFERRKIILLMITAMIVALILAAASMNFIVLVIASLLIGLFGTVAQQIVPMAAHLAPAMRRGSVVGSVMSGLLIGILGARTLSGFVAEYLGWRAMFWIAAGIMLLIALLVRLIFPRVKPISHEAYGEIMASLPPLLKEEPVLRESAILGGLLFAGFSIFWSTLTLHLESPSFKLGAAASGLFGLIGIVGALAAPIAGRLSDKDSPRRVVGFGIGCTVLSFIIFALGGFYLFGLVAGVILLDLGVQGAQIANQSRIYALRANAQSRINAVYMFVYFVGGASGSILGSVAWAHGGWAYVSGCGILITGLALVIFFAYSFSAGKPRTKPYNAETRTE